MKLNCRNLGLLLPSLAGGFLGQNVRVPPCLGLAAYTPLTLPLGKRELTTPDCTYKSDDQMWLGCVCRTLWTNLSCDNFICTLGDQSIHVRPSIILSNPFEIPNSSRSNQLSSLKVVRSPLQEPVCGLRLPICPVS